MSIGNEILVFNGLYLLSYTNSFLFLSFSILTLFACCKLFWLWNRWLFFISLLNLALYSNDKFILWAVVSTCYNWEGVTCGPKSRRVIGVTCCVEAAVKQRQGCWRWILGDEKGDFGCWVIGRDIEKRSAMRRSRVIAMRATASRVRETRERERVFTIWKEF